MRITKWLGRMLLLSGVLTALNLLLFQWVPTLLPMANFLILRTIIIAFVESEIWYAVIGCLLTVLIFWGARSVKRDGILISSLSMVLFLADLVSSLVFFPSLDIGVFCICSICVDVIVVVLFVRYFIWQIRIRRTRGGLCEPR